MILYLFYLLFFVRLKYQMIYFLSLLTGDDDHHDDVDEDGKYKIDFNLAREFSWMIVMDEHDTIS